MTAVAFLVAAAVATLVRVLATAGQPAGRLPWRTLTVNVAGAFVLGLLLAADWVVDPVVVATAGVGSLTTFSTVAAETAGLIDDGCRRTAAGYLVITVVLGVAAAWLGIGLGAAA